MKQKKLKKKSKAGKRKQKKKAVVKKALDLMPNTKSLTTDISVLEEAFEGDKKMVLFFLAWMKNNRNATKAFLELNPKASYAVAGVMGSRLLKRVSIELVLESYGIGVSNYFDQLKQGMKASTTKEILTGADDFGPVYSTIQEPDHKTRRAYHESLGKMLGFEGKENGNTMAVQINNQNSIDNLNDDELDDLIS